MIRNLKLLGLALVAVLALNAIPASAATFRSEVEPTTLTGTQETGKNFFEVDAGLFECDGITFHGTMATKTENPIAVTPTYTKTCSGFGSTQVTVDMNGCGYRLNIDKYTGSGQGHGTFDIECKEGNEIEATARIGGVLKCTVDIPAQNEVSGIEYFNFSSGATAYITFVVATTTIKYTQTAGEGLGKCTTTGLTSNGFYADTGVFTGETDPGNVQKGIMVE